MKETTEALKGILALSAILVTEFKDGVQAADFSVIVNKIMSEPLQSKLMEAYNGIEKVPTEISTLSAVEIFKMVPDVYPELEALIYAIKK